MTLNEMRPLVKEHHYYHGDKNVRVVKKLENKHYENLVLVYLDDERGFPMTFADAVYPNGNVKEVASEDIFEEEKMLELLAELE